MQSTTDVDPKILQEYREAIARALKVEVFAIAAANLSIPEVRDRYLARAVGFDLSKLGDQPVVLRERQKKQKQTIEALRILDAQIRQGVRDISALKTAMSVALCPQKARKLMNTEAKRGRFTVVVRPGASFIALPGETAPKSVGNQEIIDWIFQHGPASANDVMRQFGGEASHLYRQRLRRLADLGYLQQAGIRKLPRQKPEILWKVKPIDAPNAVNPS